MQTATVNGPARIAFPKKNFGQRQASPVLLRHVYTSNQGIPVSMAVLPNGANGTNNTQQIQTTYQTISTDGNQTIGQGGQYILVQRAGIITSENHSAPRASSAPPAQNQVPMIPNNLVDPKTVQIIENNISFFSFTANACYYWNTN